jgi:hypothetical protein
MGTKTDEQLDDMVAHVRYEIVSLMGFLYFGNAWIQNIEGMPAGLDKFVAGSMLEAELIHTRCVAEFLRRSDDPDDTVTARDYVPGWHWTNGERLKDQIAEIHGRVAHLGLIRCSVQREATDFNWYAFLTSTAVPTLLGGFREFLGRLDADRMEQFAQPGPGEATMDLVADITRLIGQ